MKREQVFVRAQLPDGSWNSVDVMELDDESFRAFVFDVLMRAGLVFALKDEVVGGEHITYHAKK